MFQSQKPGQNSFPVLIKRWRTYPHITVHQLLSFKSSSLLMPGALHSQSSASVFFSPDSLTDPPLAVIVSDSMKPTLERGDIAFIREVDPGTIKVGDVVAVWVPTTKYRNEYDYPPCIIYRVTEIKEIRDVTYLEIKGDNCDKCRWCLLRLQNTSHRALLTLRSLLHRLGLSRYRSYYPLPAQV